jgi:predicted DNA-binding transcriptional regulator AlpA
MSKQSESVELINTEELAAILKMTVKSLRSAHSRGHVPRGVRIPGLGGLRWDRAKIDQWLRERMRGAA